MNFNLRTGVTGVLEHTVHSITTSLQNSAQIIQNSKWSTNLVWAGHVSTQKMAVFDSYSSRSGEIFFNEIYKLVFETNK
jgi:hypothetical protein